MQSKAQLSMLYLNLSIVLGGIVLYVVCRTCYGLVPFLQGFLLEVGKVVCNWEIAHPSLFNRLKGCQGLVAHCQFK